MLASHLDQKTFSAGRVCVEESASRGMCLWLVTPLPWWSAIWGDVTVGEENRGPRSRTNKCWKEHGGGAAVNAHSVARLYIPPHTQAHRQHTSGCMRSIGMENTPREELNNGGTLTKTGRKRITRTMMWISIQAECNNASGCKKSQIQRNTLTSEESEEPTPLWGNHKSINHQQTRLQAGPHTRIYKHCLH